MAAPLQDCAVLFGDSITNRQDVPGSIQALFCEHYRRQMDILNRGFGGYNTTYARALFDQIFATANTPNVPQIRLVTIWFGANDAVHPGRDQHVPLATYTANLRFFLDSLTSLTSPYAAAHTPISVVLITPPPVAESELEPGGFGGAKRSNKAVREYVAAVNALVADFRERRDKGRGKGWAVEGIDMYEAVWAAAGGEEGNLPQFFTDGLHLSTKGYAVLWQEYTKLVQGPLAGRGLDWLDVQDCPPRVPMWDDVVAKAPEVVVPGMRHAPIHDA